MYKNKCGKPSAYLSNFSVLSLVACGRLLPYLSVNSWPNIVTNSPENRKCNSFIN